MSTDTHIGIYSNIQASVPAQPLDEVLSTSANLLWKLDDVDAL